MESRLPNPQYGCSKIRFAEQREAGNEVFTLHANSEQFDAPSTNTAADTAVLEPITVQKLLADFPNNPYARAAAVLVSMGIPVVHLLPGEKISHAKIGAATLDLNVIYARATEDNFNAGAYAYTDGDLSLFDVDGDAVKNKIKEDTGHDLNELDVFTVATPNGGWHYYFRKDDELRALGNVAASYGTHIGFELRQNNQYCVAPFSVLADGRTWTILKTRPVGKMPPWLRLWIQKQKASKIAQPAAKTLPATGSTNIERQEQFENWLTANHVEFEPATWDEKEQRWEYIVTTRCPWEHAHGEKNGDKDFALYLSEDGKLGAKCQHTSCKNEWPLPDESAWKNFKALLESKNGHITMYPSPQVTVGTAAGSQAETPIIESVPYESWREKFVNGSQMTSKPFKFLIKNFLTEDSSLFFTGLSSHGKTLLGLSLSRAFVYGTPLFGYEGFEVLEQLPVLYLIPEAGEQSFKARMKAFELDDPTKFVNPDMFLTRTRTQGRTIKLDDPALLTAAKGRVIILDTAIRFTNSTDENSAAENRYLSEGIYELLRRGARAVIGIHHSPKNAEGKDTMSLENMTRGSGDLGAMLDISYGVRMLDRKSSKVYIENLKPRDFVPPEPFVLQGRPFIDEDHDFKMISPPGKTPLLIEAKVQSKIAAEKGSNNFKAACVMFAGGKSQNDVVKQLKIHKTTASDYYKWWAESQAKEENQ